MLFDCLGHGQNLVYGNIPQLCLFYIVIMNVGNKCFITLYQGHYIIWVNDNEELHEAYDGIHTIFAAIWDAMNMLLLEYENHLSLDLSYAALNNC